MDSEADLLAECAANPDDDAPRLVWADRVGGERGELVVIQCDLARGGLTPAEARLRRLRERELLERNAVAWAGDLAGVARRWSFRRGFVEAAHFVGWTSPAAWPLLRSITLDVWSSNTDGIELLRALGVVYLTEDRLPRLDRLQALAISGLEDRHVENVLDVIANAQIETLQLRHQRLDRVPVSRVLDAAPQLVSLELATNTFSENNGIEAAVRRPLRALRLGSVRMRELALLDGCVASETLEHLAFELSDGCVGLAEILSRFRALRSIEIGGNVADAAGAVGNAELPGVTLRVRGNIDEKLVYDLGEWFDDLELVDARDELLHASPAAMGTLGPPWLVWSQPAVIARIDRPEIFDVPAFDASDYITLGRGADVPIRLMSGTVARRHARLHWRDGVHHIRDLHSTNGIYLRGRRIEHAALADGDEMVLGDVRLRYFIGPGARDRAVASISGLR